MLSLFIQKCVRRLLTLVQVSLLTVLISCLLSEFAPAAAESWTVDQVLGTNSQAYPYAGIYEYDDLVIGDNVVVYSSGISQLVIKVNGTLTLGKNVTFRVRNGYYENAPGNPIAGLNADNLSTRGEEARAADGSNRGFRLYPDTFGKGGDGGGPGTGFFDGGQGGGGFGGGQGGAGNGGDGADGKKASGGQGGLATGLGQTGSDGLATDDELLFSGGGGGGGNGGNGGQGGTYCWTVNAGCGGGGGGYGGGVLTIIASKVDYDPGNPPKFIVAGQKGGAGGVKGDYENLHGQSGQDGQGGLITFQGDPSLYIYEGIMLGDSACGEHKPPSTDNGGHGIVAGNPQKVFVNGVEAVAATGITLDKKSLVLEAGSTGTISALVGPENVTNGAVAWKSDWEYVATVQADGTVKAVSEGQATITCTALGGHNVKKTITVIVQPASGGNNGGNNWTTNRILAQNGPYPYAGIYEYEDLSIGDNVEIDSSGISQLVIKVNGTIALGKNATFRVRNGFYENAPGNPITELNTENIDTRGEEARAADGSSPGFRMYPDTFGLGGDGGGPGTGFFDGGQGGGGFGGGQGGAGNGGDGADGKNTSGGQGGLATGLGQTGSDGLATDDESLFSGGGGGGGNGGNGGQGGTYCWTLNAGCGGGGGGYGGGVLTIIASKVNYDPGNPPRFIVAGQKGGPGGEKNYAAYCNGQNGLNGEGGLLIFQGDPSLYLYKGIMLENDIFGTHEPDKINGGHGIVTGNPQKIFINGKEPVQANVVNLDKTELVLSFYGDKQNTGSLVAAVNSDATNNKIAWKSDNEHVAAVDRDGTVTPLTEGTAIITATALGGNGTSQTCKVTVVDKTALADAITAAQILLDGIKVGIEPGNVPQSAHDAYARAISEAGAVVSDADALKKDVEAQLSALQIAGEAFKQAIIVAVSGVSLEPQTLYIKPGEDNGRLEATVEPGNATNKQLMWTSSNEKVATVDNGVVTRVSPGSTTITVKTYDGGFTDKAVVYVTRTTGITGLTLDYQQLTIPVGMRISLNARAVPVDAATTSITWKSSDNTVATVDNGMVTAVKPGPATITAATADGSYSDQCFITVKEATANDVTWNNNQVLGQNGPYNYAGIYQFDNLSIGDNVEITSNGISQMVLKVNGVLNLGKNAAIRVRNGSYAGAPQNKISDLTESNLKSQGTLDAASGACLYPDTFGKGGNGGDGGTGGAGSVTVQYTLGGTFYIAGNGGSGGSGGGGGYGGGQGGPGGQGGAPGHTPSYAVGIKGYDGYNGADNGGDGGYGGSGSKGIGGLGNQIGSAGGTGQGYGWGGNSGGGSGYGGGVLTIIADSIVYDPANPPHLLVSGQMGGGGNQSGKNGGGGLIIIDSSHYNPQPSQWNLGSTTYVNNNLPSNNGGHGIVTGNPQKVFINGIEWATNDAILPVVTNTDPVNSSLGIAKDQIVQVTFGKNVERGTNFNGITLRNNINDLLISCTITLDGSILTIKPLHDLSPNSYYTVGIPADAVVDAAGNNMASNYCFSFITVTNSVIEQISGDINNDGAVEGLDALDILCFEAQLFGQMSAEATQTLQNTPETADVNGDGLINGFDALDILFFEAQLFDQMSTAAANNLGK